MTENMTKGFASILILFIILFACERKDIPIVTDKVTDSLSIVSTEFSIQDAKKWVQEDYLESAKKSKTEESDNLVREIFWDLAFMDKMSNGQNVLVVPVEHHELDKDPNVDTYLWIFRNEGNFSGKVVEYLSSVKDETGKLNIRNFSGAMSIRDWNGKLLNGFTFEKGQPTGVLLGLNGRETLLISNIKNKKTTGTACRDIEVTTSTCDSYYYKVCIPALGTCTERKNGGTFCALTSVIVPQCYWIADFPNQTNPYLGGNNGVTAASAANLTMPGFSNPSIDVKKFMKCFGVIDSKSTYKLTIYVAEPNVGSGKTVWGTDVRHTFIGLEKNTNGAVITQVVGFYPSEMGTNWVPSHMADNGGSNYSTSTTYNNVTPDAFNKAVNAVIYQQSELYHIASYNCTTAAAYVCDAAGLTFPKNESSFPFFTMKGLSPGNLGKDLRNHQSSGTLNTSGGAAPKSKGSCN